MGCTKSKPLEHEFRTSSLHNINLRLLKTGDIILFADHDTVGSKITALFTHSKWTHVGIVVHSSGLYPNHGPLLFESCMNHHDGLKDLSSATIVKSGVRLVDLDSRIRTCQSDEISFCQLDRGEHIWDPNAMELEVQGVISELSMRPYERRPTELAFSAIDFTSLTHNSPNLSSVFCSELVAHTLQQMKVLSPLESSNEFTPADFTSKKALKGQLENGYSYGKPQPLKTTIISKQPAMPKF